MHTPLGPRAPASNKQIPHFGHMSYQAAVDASHGVRGSGGNSTFLGGFFLKTFGFDHVISRVTPGDI